MNFNNDYLIEKLEEQDERYLNKIADLKERNQKLAVAAKELYECLLARIYNPPVVKGFENQATPREREALDAFTNRDNA